MRRLLLGLLMGLLSGCGDDDCCGVKDAAIDSVPRDANPNLLEVALLPNDVVRDLDLLFVIDDSPSMIDKQTNLKNSFASFIATLSAGGLPNLHIGVITTDMGAMGEDGIAAGPIGSGPGSCAMSAGKDGVLQTQGSTMITANYISDVGGVKNYTGTLAERFNEIASVGSSGCGFEQPFRALRRALDPAQTANAGFLRSTARLGIVLLADEDDCSMEHATLVSSDTATLGPLGSFRCTRFGITCDVGGQDSNAMNQIGVKDGCHSNEQSAYLADVGRYITFIKSLKADPRQVVFGALVGNTAAFEVELRTTGGGPALPALAHSCTYAGANGIEVADPAIRIAEVAAALPQGMVASVCNASDLSTPMTELALRLKPLVGDTCLQQPIQQPAVCEAFDIDGSGGMTPLGVCDAANTPPCFSLTPDATLCPVGSQHLKVTLVRDTAVAADVWTSVRCAL